MLLGGDFKLLFSVVVVVVGWLVARRKWRRAASRREEIRRLMAFASEEAARAEREAAASYKIYATSPAAPEPVGVELATGAGRQLQYQCEVCFSPTTTRCKQCKAVRYCSRKCQILHWRQGHKDECHMFTSNENIDMGVQSLVKESEQDESSKHAVGIEGIRTTKPDKSSSETSNSKFHELSENVDIETEVRDNRKGTDLNVKTSVHSLPDECSSSTNSIEMPVASNNNLKDYNRHNGQTTMDEESTASQTEKPSLINHEFGLAASCISNKLQCGQIDADEKSKSSTFSSFSATGSEEYSLSESSTPSSDFWAGTVEHMRSKINALKAFDDVDMPNSRSSFPPSSGISPCAETFGPGTSKVMVDDSCPSTSMPKKSIALSKLGENGLNSREPLSLSCKLPGQYGDSNTPTNCSLEKEAKLSSSDDCHGGISEEHVPIKPVDDVSILQSLAPKRLDDETDRTNGILDTLKCQGNASSRLRSTESHLSSSACTRKPAIQVVQSVENERIHDNASCSLDSSNYLRSATSGTNLSMKRIVDQLRASNFIRHSSLGAASGVMGSFSYELFVKLYNWKKIEVYPCGLINCGNSCYANSVLQCLAFTPPVAAYCVQGLHAKTCKTKEWCFICEFEELVKKAKEGNNPLSPARILSQMQHMGSHLGNGKEEDAHEFLRYAIDAMQSVCLKEAEANVPSSLVEETTLVGLTFGGYLQSKIECMRCGGKSKQNERIMDLTVEIEGEIGRLEDALHQFTHSEILDGENKYHCGRCKSYERAKKKLRVLEAPNVLVVSLKRFQTGKFGKLNKAVKFPEILNLAPYMSGTSDKSPIYQLYGVVVHLDVMNAVFSGHYVCYIKNNQGKWFKADDSVVQAVELEKVLSNDAYILFYARCSPRAPRVIRSSMVSRDLRKTKSKAKSHPWDVSMDAPTSNGYFDSYHSRSSHAEEESCSSEYSSSYFSSEAGSHSTESSNRESVSTMDLDHCSSDAESSSCCSVNTSPKADRDASKGRGSCNRVGRYSRESESNRLGSSNSFENGKVGVYLRRSMS